MGSMDTHMYRIIGFILFIAIYPARVGAGENSPCANIKDATQRLECYDFSEKREAEGWQVLGLEDEKLPLRERIKKEENLSIVGDFVIMPHRPTYIMPVTYMANTNIEPFRETYGDQAEKLQNIEVKFQLSFKVPLWLDIADKDVGLWFGYTQLSLWQLYNSQVSSPFRETNYEPELALVFETDHELFGMHNSFILLGIGHQSNGQSEPLSRSWNRLYLSFVLEHKNIVAYFKPWYRLPEDSEDDDNPDIDDYIGHGELSLFYRKNKRVTGLRFWNNLRSDHNRTSVQLDWSFPIKSGFKAYVQIFDGYAETLVDYNHRTRRFGVGIMLTDWF